MKSLLFFVAFLFLIFLGQAQDTTIYTLKGKVLDGNELKPLTYVLVINKDKLFYTVSDTSGKFRILFMRNDQIQISIIGYKTLVWTATDEDLLSKTVEKVFLLEQQTYPIGAVNVFAIRWKTLVHNIKNFEEKPNEQQKMINQWLKTQLQNEAYFLKNPNTALVITLPLYTKLERQEQKIKERVKIEQLNKMAAEKFNENLVSRVTGLEGEELKKFMNYVTFDRDFILKTPDYDLIMIIKQIFEEYKQKNKK